MISVVIPLYNKENAIRVTLESVLAQSYTDYEVIIVDDGSTDNSAAVAANLKDPRVRIIQKDNGGVSSARNAGIKAAKSEYIAFLDADDLWDKEYLAEQLRMIADFPDAAMWGINFAETREGKQVRRVPTALPDGYRGYVENYFQMRGRVSDLFCSSSVVIRREVFEKVGLFDERIKYSEDCDMWWRIIATHKVAFYDQYLVFYRWDAENRAMKKPRDLRYFVPYYVDKYQNPTLKQNKEFYRWINRWCAVHIRRYYFEGSQQDREEARAAAAKLDYSVIPFKYRLFFHSPMNIATVIYRMDKCRRRDI